jgi:sec-independent protein translocase protein TatB
MFDIGISEIMVIAVVALVVIGPERLPRVARTVGTLLGRAQRYVNDVKAEVNREMELEELKKLQTQMKSAAEEIQQSVHNAGAEVQTAVQDAEKSLNESIAPPPEVIVTQPAFSGLAELAPLAEPQGTPGTATLVAPEAPPASAATPESLTPPQSPAPAPAPTAAPSPEPSPAPSAIPPADNPAQSTLFPEHTVR